MCDGVQHSETCNINARTPERIALDDGGDWVDRAQNSIHLTIYCLVQTTVDSGASFHLSIQDT